MNDPCGWCDHPEEGHGTRYAAGRGNHTWEPARGPAFIPYTRRNDRPCFCATTGDGAQHTCGTPSDRLPMPPEARQSPTNAELDQQELAEARVHGYWLPSDPPEENINDHDMHCPDLPVHTDRPGIIRRILNARKAST